MSESQNREDEPVDGTSSREIPSNRYSDLLGYFPAEIFEGFEEFVRRSRERSKNRRVPPPWW